MTSEDITARVQRVFSQVFGRSIPFSSSLQRSAEPRWTSLKHVEFIIALEQEFSLRFDGSDATDMINIPVVLERVQRRLS